MELHIWGPAFGLPSIDPECLAAIAYFRCIPELNPISTSQSSKSSERLWTIVPSSNPLLSPTRTLPALRDSHTWIGGGFNGIISYLRSKSNGEWDLDRDLRGSNSFDDYDDDPSNSTNPPSSTASYTWSESIAYSSFIRSRLGPLIDISLYVSDVNYSNVTRPEYSKSGMLPWPVQYYVPGQKRAEVWERCEEVLRRYGLSAKDVDPNPILDSPIASTGGLDANTVGAGLGAGTGKNGTVAGKGTGGISSIFGRRPSASTAGVVFKLQALISKSLTPIAARLIAADSDPALGLYFFKHENPTSIDCLIFGYICLAIYPELPNPFLAEGIQELDEGRGGRRMCAWTHEFRRRVFGSKPIDGNKILSLPPHEESEGNLPWGKVEKADLPWLTGHITSTAGEYLSSWIPSWAKRKPETPKKQESEEEKDRRMQIQRAMRKEKVARIATVVIGVGAFLAFLLSNGIVRIETVESEDEVVEEEELEALEKEGAGKESREGGGNDNGGSPPLADLSLFDDFPLSSPPPPTPPPEAESDENRKPTE